MGLMEKFADPNLMHSLSVSDKLAGAGITTIMGMGITFIILILLWGCIALMTKFTYRPKGDKASKGTAGATPSGAETQPVAVTVTAPDNALIAVITAAIAASEGGSADNLVVRKISRISGQTTAWGSAGRLDCIDSRKF